MRTFADTFRRPQRSYGSLRIRVPHRLRRLLGTDGVKLYVGIVIRGGRRLTLRRGVQSLRSEL